MLFYIVIYLYDDLRNTLLGKALEIVPHLNSLSDEQKLVVLFSYLELVRICAKTCAMILQRRQCSNRKSCCTDSIQL